MELPIESFLASIEYSWNEKWESYGYTNSEKTGLILNNLKFSMKLREDVMELVIDTLLVFNKDDDVIKYEILEFMEIIKETNK